MKRKINYNLLAGGILAGGMLLFILIGCFVLPYDPEAMNDKLRFAGISLAHPFGCDNFGRDIFTRVMVGARTTLAVALGTGQIKTGAPARGHRRRRRYSDRSSHRIFRRLAG